jgi:hypothetical protein
MYFHPEEHIYFTFFNKEAIILDLKKNAYLLLPTELSKALSFALTHQFEIIDINKNKFIPLIGDHEEMLFSDIEVHIHKLRKLGILSNKFYYSPAYQHKIDNNFSSGAENVDWKLPYGELNKVVPNHLIREAYIYLALVHMNLKLFGFYHIIKWVKKKKNVKYINVSPDQFETLITALNKACFYFPIKTKCLEWATALALLGLKRKWKCNLEIGVQTMPFIAHAWVNVDNKVLADDNTLPQSLSVILSEPF